MSDFCMEESYILKARIWTPTIPQKNLKFPQFFLLRTRKMAKIWLKMAQNGPRITQNDPKRPKMIQNRPKWSKICSRGSILLVSIFLGGPLVQCTYLELKLKKAWKSSRSHLESWDIMTEFLEAWDWLVKFSFSSRSMRLKVGSSCSRLETRDSMMQILDLVSKVEMGISQGTGTGSKSNVVVSISFLCGHVSWHQVSLSPVLASRQNSSLKISRGKGGGQR